MTTPTTLNGFPVIADAPRKRDESQTAVVVYRRGDPMPYVVATWTPTCGTTWTWGHYFETLPMAAGYFAEMTGQATFADA